ncbi:MAG: hypothetical protein ACR2MP_30290 [Streptosporangiaceae bacterium]
MESMGDRHGGTAGIAPDEAASALAAIDGSRSWLAGRIIAPGWYHLAFGVLAGGVIAEAEARSWALFAWSVVAYTLGCSALMWLNQRRVGVAMKYFDAWTRTIYIGQVLTMSALIAIACWLELGRGMRGAFLVAGVLAVPVTVVSGRWTDAVLRARLRAGR